MSNPPLPVLDLAESVELYRCHETRLCYRINVYVHAITPPWKVDLEAGVFAW